MAKAKTTKVSESKATKKAAPIKKVIAKKASEAKKEVPAKVAPAKAVKKVAVAPKKNAKSYEPGKSLDLCLILDCTSSMSSWITRSKDTLI